VLLGVGVGVKRQLESRVFKTSVELTTIASVSPAQSSIQLTATGYVQADVASTVVPKIPGRVAKVSVRQGQRVKAGDVLLQLDAADDRANIAAAQSQVAAALADAESATARTEVARSNLGEVRKQAERERSLADQGATARAGAEDLESRVASLQNSLSAARAEASAARARAAALRAQVKVLETGLDNLTLRSPITGTVVSEVPAVGEYLGPDFGDRGIRVADLDTAVVEADVPEGRLHLVKQDAPAEIVLDAYPDRRLRGRVKEITPEVDRAKATVVIKVLFVDTVHGVLPNMSARISLLSKELESNELEASARTVVPASALAERNGAKVVFVADNDLVRMTPVSLGPPFAGGFELQSGPPPGTRVVSHPADNLADGQRIKVE
jgi:RND family efflux transporter MFP subunit